jgi:hypothetical protein
MEAWKHGSMEAWKHESMEAWKHGSMEAWKKIPSHGSIGQRRSIFLLAGLSFSSMAKPNICLGHG